MRVTPREESVFGSPLPAPELDKERRFLRAAVAAGTLEPSGDTSPTASTPSSLASSPRQARHASAAGGGAATPAPAAGQLATLQQASAQLASWSSLLQEGAGQLQPAAATAAVGSPGLEGGDVAAAQAHLLALHDHAQLMHVDTELLREGLRGARRQLQGLQRALGRMQREAARQQTLAETASMEAQCEVRLAKAEAEAYRVAAAARSTAIGSLQKSVGTLQEDKQRLELYVRQLQQSLREVLAVNAELQESSEARGQEREVVAAIAALLQQKAEQLQQAQAAATHSTQTAAEVAAGVDSLRRQLAAAHAELEGLRAANAELAQQLAATGTKQRWQRGGSREDPAAEGDVLRQRLEHAEQRCAVLEASNCQLARQAGQLVALQEEFEEAARQLVEACDQNAALSERLAEVRVQVDEVTRQLEAASSESAQLVEERDALAAQLQQSQAEVVSLTRMVRALRSPAPSGSHATGGPLHQQQQQQQQEQAWPCGAGSRSAAQESDSGSDSREEEEEEEEEEEVQSAACSAARLDFRQSSNAAAGAPSNGQLVAVEPAAAESQRVALLEEEVGILMGVVRRLQGQNRQLNAQLAVGSVPRAPALSAPGRVAAAVAPTLSLSSAAPPVALPGWSAPGAAGGLGQGEEVGEAASPLSGTHAAPAGQKPEQRRPQLRSPAASYAAPGLLAVGAAAAAAAAAPPSEQPSGGAGPPTIPTSSQQEPLFSQRYNPLFDHALAAGSEQASLSQASSVQPRHSPISLGHSRSGAHQPSLLSPLSPLGAGTPAVSAPAGPVQGFPHAAASAPPAAPAASLAGSTRWYPHATAPPPPLPPLPPPLPPHDPPTPQSASQPVVPGAPTLLESSDSESDVVQSLRQAIASLDAGEGHSASQWAEQALAARGDAHVHGGWMAHDLSESPSGGNAQGSAAGGGWPAAAQDSWRGEHDSSWEPEGLPVVAASLDFDPDSDPDHDLFDCPDFHAHLLAAPEEPLLPSPAVPRWHPDHAQQPQQPPAPPPQPDSLAEPSYGLPSRPQSQPEPQPEASPECEAAEHFSAAGEGLGYEEALHLLQQLHAEIASMGSAAPAEDEERWGGGPAAASPLRTASALGAGPLQEQPRHAAASKACGWEGGADEEGLSGPQPAVQQLGKENAAAAGGAAAQEGPLACNGSQPDLLFATDLT